MQFLARRFLLITGTSEACLALRFSARLSGTHQSLLISIIVLLVAAAAIKMGAGASREALKSRNDVRGRCPLTVV